jgi:hypothetical protein
VGDFHPKFTVWHPGNNKPAVIISVGKRKRGIFQVIEDDIDTYQGFIGIFLQDCASDSGGILVSLGQYPIKTEIYQ